MQFTEQAANQIIQAMKNENLSPEITAVRFGVKGGGCAGFTYTLDFDTHKSKFDRIFQSNNLTILIDKKSYLYVADTIVDWSDQFEDRGLKFNNPNAKTSCGCRTSFMFDIPNNDTKPSWM